MWKILQNSLHNHTRLYKKGGHNMAYIRRLIPCAPYEIKIFEAWLEELAEKEGVFLVSCSRACATFV